jgi:hypothetical protein
MRLVFFCKLCRISVFGFVKDKSKKVELSMVVDINESLVYYKAAYFIVLLHIFQLWVRLSCTFAQPNRTSPPHEEV